MVGFNGPSQEKTDIGGQRSAVSFPKEKPANDPAAAGVPDPVGSEAFVLQKVCSGWGEPTKRSDWDGPKIQN